MKCIYVKRVNLEQGVDICPAPEELDWFNEWNTTQSYLRVLQIYSAVSDCYNYFQYNSSTAFGNPDYSYKLGYMCGILSGYSCNSEEIDNKLYVRTNNGKTILIVELPIKRDRYFSEIKDINKTLRSLGL